MAWQDALTGTKFREWLLAVGGRSRIPQGHPLDPLGTSLRNLTAVAGWLAAVEAGQPLPRRGASGDQNYIDLRGAALITGGRSDAALTDFGTAVLEGWRSAGVDDADVVHELTRCVVVVEEAIRLGVDEYVAMHEFWRELRLMHSADDLFGAPELLFLASYFNQTRDGFNPWAVLATLQVDLVTETPLNWAELTSEAAQGDTAVQSAVANLQARVQDGASRPDGRITFCMAHELHDLARVDIVLVRDALNRWQVVSG